MSDRIVREFAQLSKFLPVVDDEVALRAEHIEPIAYNLEIVGSHSPVDRVIETSQHYQGILDEYTPWSLPAEEVELEREREGACLHAEVELDMLGVLEAILLGEDASRVIKRALHIERAMIGDEYAALRRRMSKREMIKNVGLAGLVALGSLGVAWAVVPERATVHQKELESHFTPDSITHNRPDGG